MAPAANRWLLTKSCDFHPGGTLQLGQILAEPKDPAFVLQPTGPLPLYQDILVEQTSRENLNITTNDELSAHFNSWAKCFAAAFKTGASASRSRDLKWHFDKLHSTIMAPSISYVEAAMRHGDVEASLKNWSFKKGVYMVTGVRVVSGARMTHSGADSSSLSASGQAAVEGGPGLVGAEAKFTSSSGDSEDVGMASDFVYAYRLNEVRYRGKVTHRPYRWGEVASADNSSVDVDGFEPVNTIDDFEVIRIMDEPMSGNAKDCNQVTVLEYERLECFISK